MVVGGPRVVVEGVVAGKQNMNNIVTVIIQRVKIPSI